MLFMYEFIVLLPRRSKLRKGPGALRYFTHPGVSKRYLSLRANSVGGERPPHRAMNKRSYLNSLQKYSVL
jgi:hypothetical protein